MKFRRNFPAGSRHQNVLMSLARKSKRSHHTMFFLTDKASKVEFKVKWRGKNRRWYDTPYWISPSSSTSISSSTAASWYCSQKAFVRPGHEFVMPALTCWYSALYHDKEVWWLIQYDGSIKFRHTPSPERYSRPPRIPSRPFLPLCTNEGRLDAWTWQKTAGERFIRVCRKVAMSIYTWVRLRLNNSCIHVEFASATAALKA